MKDSFDLLREQLADPESQEGLGESISIGALLTECIIGKQYRVPDSLVRPIELSPLGNEVFRGVLEKNRRAKPNETKLAVFLNVGCPDGALIDPRTDIAALRQALSAEMHRSHIFFAYIYGRDLHDLAASKYPEKTHLNNTESIALLRQLPQGVYQEGRTTVGPFGAIESDGFRQIPARTDVPGYLCSDETCLAVHTIELDTAESAIVRTRRLVGEYIDHAHGGTEDENARLMQRELSLHYESPSRRPSEGLFDALADAFTVEELREVVATLLRSKFRENPEARARQSKRFGQIINSPDEFVEPLERPHLLQVLMCFDNASIIVATDRAIAANTISLAEYEVRTARITRNPRIDWGVQISTRGVRSTSSSAVSERLFALLHELYYKSDFLEPADLVYGLQRVGLTDVEADPIGQAVRRLEPRKILHDLVLSSRHSATVAADFLDLHLSPENQPEDLLEGLLWKLGSNTEVLFSELARMETYEVELAEAIDKDGSPAVLRGHISNLFTAIEDALQRGLTFSTWALTVDHFLEQESFQYDPLPDVQYLSFIDEHAPTENPALLLKKDGKNTLAPLAAGFGRLAKALRASEENPTQRPPEQVPQACRFESRPFAFVHPLPYLNLDAKSRDEMVTALQDVAAIFGNQEVLKLRNSTMHGNNDFPSKSEMLLALEKISLARHILSMAGLFPQVYSLDSDLQDAFGRRELVYRRDSRETSLFSPVWPIAANMPFRAATLVIMDVAILGACGPLRFRIKPRPGTDTYWDGWPKRWNVKRAYSGSEPTSSIESQGDPALPADVG